MVTVKVNLTIIKSVYIIKNKINDYLLDQSAGLNNAKKSYYQKVQDYDDLK